MNNDRLFPIAILISIMIIGFIDYVVKSKKVENRLNYTMDYKNKFVEYINCLAERKLDNDLYNYLTVNVNRMQIELGNDGIYAYYKDGMNGIAGKNYQVLVNLLPETMQFQNSCLQDNVIAYERILSQCQSCNDCFLRHIGTLNEIKEEITKMKKNPIRLFTNGISFIMSLPIKLLNMIGIIHDEAENTIINARIFKFVTALISLVALVSNLVTIVIGWEDFIKKIGIIIEKFL